MTAMHHRRWVLRLHTTWFAAFLILSCTTVYSFCTPRRAAHFDDDRLRDDVLVPTTRRGASVLESAETADPVDERAFPQGSARGLYVVKYYKKLKSPFEWSALDDIIEPRHATRLELQPTNITLPVALLLAENETFGSLSQARKACRKGNVLIQRHGDDDGRNYTGRVGDRIYPGDILARQIRLASKENDYTANLGYSKPPFDLPVVYEDDTMALVDKPAGVVVYRQGHGSSGLLSVRAALPFVLTPPRSTSQHMLRRPASVHRLDKATSGLLVIAKTKPAMIQLSRQFHDRKVQKTYHAVVMGIPEEDFGNSLTSSEVKERYGVNVPLDDVEDDVRWQVIESVMDGKPGVTVWRALRSVHSLGAGHLTLVELHPKTGRYHQLRRHMSWVCRAPIVGDTIYDRGSPMAMKFRQNGLFLCASRITLYHLGGNSILRGEDARNDQQHSSDCDQAALVEIIDCSETNKALLSATLPLPAKFSSLLHREESRFYKFNKNEENGTK